MSCPAITKSVKALATDLSRTRQPCILYLACIMPLAAIDTCMAMNAACFQFILACSLGVIERDKRGLACRHYMENEHIEEDLRALLPKEEGKPVEKPPEAALRLRM